ncbi:uncharacterized protein LOC128429784 [Pleuronectes platessa]|uniref:uncharacterized protein LOC128429784 n=1 Tax=Pleuronectes platessa TaxID=8262 RepID=UPI00232A7735|nr:uncharacterized protein LOC128429784 [Pleuronectes platessa]
MSGSNQWRISEKMKLLLSSLLLGSLCAISSRSASSTDIVTQTPDVSVTEGDALNITCCFNSMAERIKFYWQKNLKEIGNQVIFVNYRSHSCSTLTFTYIKIEDSGKYICNVNAEIPFRVQMEGNGTVITVVPRGISDGNTVLHTFGDGAWKEVMIYTLRCLPIIAIIITSFCIYRWKVKAQQQLPDTPGNRDTSAQRIELEERDEINGSSKTSG